MIIDRIEDGVAVIENEDGSFFQVESKLLPVGAKEGSVLIDTENGYILDLQAEAVRKKKMLALQKKMFHKGE